MPLEFKDWKKGERITAEYINALQSEVKRLANIRGSGNVSVNRDSTGITVRGLDEEPKRWFAKAKNDPDGADYPTFSSWADQTTLTTEYPFVLCRPTHTDTNATGDITENVSTMYVTAFSLTRHYIPKDTQTIIEKIDGKWYVDYSLPGLWATLSADLTQATGYADSSLVSDQKYYNAAPTGTVRVYCDWLDSGKKLASGAKVFVVPRERKLYVVTSNKCQS